MIRLRSAMVLALVLLAAGWLYGQNTLTTGLGLVGELLLTRGGRPVLLTTLAGAPTNGVSGTRATAAGPGSLLFDTTNKLLYVNENTTASPTWVRPDDLRVTWTAGANAEIVDTHVFIADRAYTVTKIDTIHSTAGTDAGAVTLQPRKATGTQSPSAGVVLTTATHNLKGTIDTVTNFTLSATAADLDLATGNRLSMDITGVTTAAAGVNVTVTLKRK